MAWPVRLGVFAGGALLFVIAPGLGATFASSALLVLGWEVWLKS